MYEAELIGEKYYLTPATGSTTRDWLRGTKRVNPANLFTSFSTVITRLGQNDPRGDTVFLSPDSHSQGAGITWDANCAKLIGQAPEALMNHRARIGHSANFDALLTVSGYGNEFRNFYLMHGRGNASNLHCCEVTGARNSFYNVHFAGPLHATEAGTAGYSVLELTGAQECYFKNCVIGADTIARAAANSSIRIGSDGTTRNIFEDCIIMSMSSAGTPYYLEIGSGVTYGWTMFKNCQFFNFSSSWATALTLGINFAPAATAHRVILDSRCCMYNVTDVVANGKEAGVLIGSVAAANTSVTTAVGIGMNLIPDHTA